MKYRDIDLVFKEDYKISLKKYKEILENSQINNQSYLIEDSRYGVIGRLILHFHNDITSLLIDMLFEESKLDKTQLCLIIDEIIDSLSVLFSDKTSIAILLENGIDLQSWNIFKYKKFGNKNYFLHSNIRNNVLFSKLENEIKAARSSLTNQKLSFVQRLQMQYLWWLHHPEDYGNDLLLEYENGTISLSELFHKAYSLIWEDINSKNTTRKITFNDNGSINFTRRPISNDNRFLSEFYYNILNNNFVFRAAHPFDDDMIKYEDNDIFTNIIFENIDISHNVTYSFNVFHIKETGRKKVTYVSPIIENSSISLELWFDKEENLENCYIDFRTHKSNDKINGLYHLVIKNGYAPVFDLRFISRDGHKSYDISDRLERFDSEGYAKVKEGNVTVDLLDNLIYKIMLIINRESSRKGKKEISLTHENIISNITDMQTDGINQLNEIKEEIPLPHLRENIETFIESQGRKKSSNTRRLKI